ncbi:hypothetical protein N7638_02380 [Achromobacter mucicolens]|uniref:hypothetical protein n=1 Tax=Achromobacter mucicolens TaxID=1389922 RepID=UPI000B923136|nr:hypothetical protein [Achromobacter mucicolens]MDG9966871.1 hypothetical protein [Achromobacter mucicolens]OXC89397.1 hypothetical protein BMR85_018495 [Achromobacter sp. KAs 3-5]
MNPHLSLRMRVFCCSDGAGLGIRLGAGLGTPSAGSAWLGCISAVALFDHPGDVSLDLLSA